MNIVEAFETLRRHGHVIDQYSFDKDWLGRKPGYFAYLKSTQREPSVETLMRFQLKLLERRRRDARWCVDTGELADLVKTTITEIRERCA
tara:strand:- start:1023 stop:1292 length:270 start_codon:yes stop_codon:yes gene_type:complete